MKIIDSPILFKIIENKGKEFNEFMEGFGSTGFPEWKIDELCNWINEEFLLYGLLENENPNEYGIELEYLLDKINQKRVIL